MRRLFAFLVTLVLVLLCAAPLLAQDGPKIAAGDTGLCVLYGSLIAVAVSILKRFPFGIGKWIGTHPKVCAAVLSSVAALAPLLGKSGLNWAELATCIAAYFAGSIGTYETLLKPAGNIVGLGAEKFLD